MRAASISTRSRPTRARSRGAAAREGQDPAGGHQVGPLPGARAADTRPGGAGGARADDLHRGGDGVLGGARRARSSPRVPGGPQRATPRCWRTPTPPGRSPPWWSTAWSTSSFSRPRPRGEHAYPGGARSRRLVAAAGLGAPHRGASEPAAGAARRGGARTAQPRPPRA